MTTTNPMPRRRTLAEARAARLLHYRYATTPPAPDPTKSERGQLSFFDWKRQFLRQHGRCASCDKLATPRCRRLRVDASSHLVCQKCWWGKGNVVGFAP